MALSYGASVTTGLTSTTFGFGSLKALGFVAGEVKLARGTYGATVCVKPTGAAFASGASFALSGTKFTLLPATLVAA